MSTDLPGLSAMNLKKDIIQFQDETLKNIRQMQYKLDDKYAKSDQYLNEKITKFDLKINLLENKITELSNLITTDNSMKEKLESLFKFKEETQDTIFKRRAKFNELEKQFNDNIDRINKILMNTVIYPTVIGKTAKFQTFHEFIDYVILEISQLNIFKNKSQMDSFTSFKKKIDGALEAFKIQMNNLTPKEITNQLLNDLAQKIDSTFKLYDEKLQNIRAENFNYSIAIKKKTEEMNKQINNLMIEQNYINKVLKKIQKFEFLNILNNEITEVNEKINKAFNILRDLSSFHPEVKHNYRQELEQKSSKKVFSGVKEYIKGFINAEELSSMKKFSFQNSKTKIYDTPFSNQKIGQNISIENSFNNYFSQKKQNNDYINKKFVRKKSVNFSLEDNIISNKLAEPINLKRNMFSRKNTVSFKKKVGFEASEINNNAKNNIQTGGKITNFIIEEENEINNNSNNSDKDNDNINKYMASKKSRINKPDFKTNIIKDKIYINTNENNKTVDTNEAETKKEINLYLFNDNKREKKENKREMKYNIFTESEHFNNNINDNNNSNKKRSTRISSLNKESIKNEFSNEEKPYILNLKNNISQESFCSESEIKSKNNKIKNINKKITNSDINNSLIKTKLNKTFSNFPKINHDNNNISIPIKSGNYRDRINTDNFYKKKFLMLNPNESPLNNIHKTFEEMFKVNLKINVNKTVRIKKK